jgi:hypothetical protein
MVRLIARGALGAAMLVGWLTAPAGAREDLSQMLVGRWSGQVVWPRVTADRLLVIRSIEQRDGKWVLTAAYGVKGKGPSPVVDGSLEKAGKEVVLKFKVHDGPQRRLLPMELMLVKDGKHLSGSLYITEGLNPRTPRPAKFEKAEAAE